MKRPATKLKVRIAYEPNRFSSDALNDVYERLNPTKSRSASKEDNKDKEGNGADQSTVEGNK